MCENPTSCALLRLFGARLRLHASNLHALTAQHDEQRKVFRAPEADDDWKPAQCRFLSLPLFSRMHAHSHHPNVRVLRDASYQSPQEAGQVLKSYILNTEDLPAPCVRRHHLGSAAPPYGGGYVDRAY